MRRGGARWWAGKIRQFRSHLGARIAPGERADLAGWAPAWALTLFDAMHPADRRHGLDVVASLRASGDDDPELLLAGLLHDCGKGDVGVWPRVAMSLGDAYGAAARALVRSVPFGRWRDDLARLERHPEVSARIVEAAGGSPRTVGLIRHQAAPIDPVAGERLRLADEAN